MDFATYDYNMRVYFTFEFWYYIFLYYIININMYISDVIVIDTWMLFPHRLRQLTVLPLHVPVHSLAITTSNSHIFAGLRDGKLIIIGVKNRSEIRWRRCHPWGLKLNRSFIKISHEKKTNLDALTVFVHVHM